MDDRERAQHYLKSLGTWIGDLRWYISVAESQDLSEFDERVRESFPFEWDNIVGRVKRLQNLADAGHLQSSEREDFRGIAEELTDLLPAMQRLRLRVPDLDALARAA